MSRYHTGIGGEGLPSVIDLTSVLAGVVDDAIHLFTRRRRDDDDAALDMAAYIDDEDAHGVTASSSSSFLSQQQQQHGVGDYDAATQSWAGSGGLRYRVPLYPPPSARHARVRTRNVKVLMDNCRRLCVADDLPCTAEERRFWASYRFLGYRLFLTPLCVVTPPLYVLSRLLQHRMPSVLAGRTIPLLLGCAMAEWWAEATYPAHTLLCTALRARTPLGDAARAEWARLQSLDVPLYLYTSYQLHCLLGSVPEAFLFGGNLAALCG